MNKTTITVDFAVGDEVFYLVNQTAEVKTTISEGNYYTTEIVTDIKIKKGKISQMGVRIDGSKKGHEVFAYNIDNMADKIEDYKCAQAEKVFATKSGARKARRREMRHWIEKFTKYLWPADIVGSPSQDTVYASDMVISFEEK